MMSASTAKGSGGDVYSPGETTTVGEAGERREGESIGLRLVLGDRIRYAAERLWRGYGDASSSAKCRERGNRQRC
jgi:hypothetical protein